MRLISFPLSHVTCWPALYGAIRICSLSFAGANPSGPCSWLGWGLGSGLHCCGRSHPYPGPICLSSRPSCSSSILPPHHHPSSAPSPRLAQTHLSPGTGPVLNASLRWPSLLSSSHQQALQHVSDSREPVQGTCASSGQHRIALAEYLYITFNQRVHKMVYRGKIKQLNGFLSQRARNQKA